MIKIIKGVYGHLVNGIVRPKTKDDEPFTLTPEQEERLVCLGVAEYVTDSETEPEMTEDIGPIGFDEIPPEEPPYNVAGIPVYNVDMKASELREIGAMCGLSFKVGMNKKEMVAALDSHIAENMVEGVEVDENGEISVEYDEPAPVFDAAEAVE